MKRLANVVMSVALIFAIVPAPVAQAYVFDTMVPAAGGCPQFDRWSLSLANPLTRQWSTSLPLAPPTIVTSAPAQTSAQLTEIDQAITDSFSVWTGVTGSTFNLVAYPGLIAPLARVSAQSACSNDAETNVDGVNTICFNQPSAGFTTGVLAFTRTFTANAPGVSVGSSAMSTFAGQILDADTLSRNDGQATFATPAGLSTQQGKGAYDLESILAHELGHWFGLDHSAVWRSMMFPYAPPPGQFLGDRPTAQVPDGPLSDDDRTAVRALYPDPNDSLNVGSIRGRILPANPFALATIPPTSSGRFVTGIVGASVVAVDADTGSVVAGTLSGWTCDASSPPLQFDGSFDIERLAIGHNYMLYAEPLDGLVVPSDFGDASDTLCPQTGPSACALPPTNTNFNPRILPANQ
jgi:hypothetical protein